MVRDKKKMPEIPAAVAQSVAATERAIRTTLQCMIGEGIAPEARYLILLAAFVSAVKELGGNPGVLGAGFDMPSVIPIEVRPAMAAARERGVRLLEDIRETGALYAVAGVLMASVHIQYVADGGTRAGANAVQHQLLSVWRSVPGPKITCH
jgi:hypothetical protein